MWECYSPSRLRWGERKIVGQVDLQAAPLAPKGTVITTGDQAGAAAATAPVPPPPVSVTVGAAV